jgi:DNA-binding transcriptional MerR regulator
VAAPREQQQRHFRIGELAERSGVSVATIKFYIREGLLPPAPVKTGRTMGYYDQAYLERLVAIRKLRDEHYLPLRVIRAVLEERGDAPLAREDAEMLARVAPRVLERLDPDRPKPASRAELAARFGVDETDLALFEEIGLLGGASGWSDADLELLSALARAEQAGVTRDRFPAVGIGHYVELLGELARREVRTFMHATRGVPQAELEELALRAIAVSEPIIALVRRKLILRALREELHRTKEEP